MSDRDLRIIFMGTPDFAVPSLKAAIDKYNIVAVVTAPDKPSGRGLKIQTSPVKDLAVAHNIPVLQPERLKSPEFLEELKSYNADLQIVVAFRMLPEQVWNMPPLGTFNLHASLLPQYRGAAPINWALINGETTTGVTTFFLRHEIDTGDIIFQESEAILEEDNFETLYGKLMNRGAALVLKTIDAIEKDNVKSIPQKEFTDLKSAPKIHKETCKIDWSWTSAKVKNFVRGLSPYPAAWTLIDGKVCKIYKVSIDKGTVLNTAPGTITSDHKSTIQIGTGNGSLFIEELQMEGKKRMSVGEFLRGNKLQNQIIS